ncbi:hypothetical protein [Devosia sp.]|uniref:hypothetical protein n=1 Tax=Devosia sp. TaxID=1871048 RepID=UPI003A8D487F
MPAPPWNAPNYPSKQHTLGHAAEMGQLMVLRCNLCRRSATYLAADLAALLGPHRDALTPPFACSGCGKTRYIRVTLRPPDAGDWGRLTVRRPGPIRRTQTWRSVLLGD